MESLFWRNIENIQTKADKLKAWHVNFWENAEPWPALITDLLEVLIFYCLLD